MRPLAVYPIEKSTCVKIESGSVTKSCDLRNTDVTKFALQEKEQEGTWLRRR
jgi:hypothetical protein